ncbi:MAG: hypothetical protein ACO36I_02585 [Candidatus Latescibacterota bacterium]|jgi:hypothetical protein
MNPMTWTFHPLKDESRLKSACLVLIIIATSFIIGWSFQSNTFAWVSFILLTIAMARYFLPTKYTLDETGVTISMMGHQKKFIWAQFKRADQHPDGIFLSPFSKPHRLDTFRGQFLKTGTQTQEIFHVIQQHTCPKSP